MYVHVIIFACVGHVRARALLRSITELTPGQEFLKAFIAAALDFQMQQGQQ